MFPKGKEKIEKRGNNRELKLGVAGKFGTAKELKGQLAVIEPRALSIDELNRYKSTELLQFGFIPKSFSQSLSLNADLMEFIFTVRIVSKILFNLSFFLQLCTPLQPDYNSFPHMASSLNRARTHAKLLVPAHGTDKLGNEETSRRKQRAQTEKNKKCTLLQLGRWEDTPTGSGRTPGKTILQSILLFMLN